MVTMNSFTTTQKIRSFGTSHGIVLPAKNLKELGVKNGEDVEVLVRKKITNLDDRKILEIAEKLFDRYDSDYRDLAGR